MTLVDVQVVKLGVEEMGFAATQPYTCTVHGQAQIPGGCSFVVRDADGRRALSERPGSTPSRQNPRASCRAC